MHLYYFGCVSYLEAITLRKIVSGQFFPEFVLQSHEDKKDIVMGGQHMRNSRDDLGRPEIPPHRIDCNTIYQVYLLESRVPVGT